MKRFDWDIFCTIIDNYGDIGVCWRLARQLAQQHGQAVRLWVDDWTNASRLIPLLADHSTVCHVSEVEIQHWASDFPSIVPARSVIEAFACELPDRYIRSMLETAPTPAWFNLEYLSAEQWVEGCHGLYSTHPSTGLRKQFFFPGFTAKTGGLIREFDLPTQIAHHLARRGRDEFLLKLGFTQRSAQDIIYSLFCYDVPQAVIWLQMLKDLDSLCTVIIPEGRIWSRITSWLQNEGQNQPLPGEQRTIGRLRLVCAPFMSQAEYDRLLWSCDFNFVRGEDSFLRGQYAGLPICWHIYQQEENAHFEKLDAFLEVSGTPPTLARWMRWWNGMETGDPKPIWLTLQADWPLVQEHARQWASHLSCLPSLSDSLMAQVRHD